MESKKKNNSRTIFLKMTLTSREIIPFFNYFFPIVLSYTSLLKSILPVLEEYTAT